MLIALGTLVVLFIFGAVFVFLDPNNQGKENGSDLASLGQTASILASLGQMASVLVSPPIMAFVVGCIGGFVGVQRRIKKMSDEDLTLLANSWVYICLSPLVGGILAVLIYVLFISGLLAGHLFPEFDPDFPDPSFIFPDPPGEGLATKGLGVIFQIHGDAQDYAKLIFWCFLAGFSERFVTDIISRFESQSSEGNQSSDA